MAWHCAPEAVAQPKAKVKSHAAGAYPRSHFEKGLYFKQIGEPKQAIVEFLKASHENPKNVRIFYEQALIFQQLGYFKLAESSLKQAISIKPDYDKARMLLAEIHLQQGNIGGAMQELSHSLGLEKPKAQQSASAPPKSAPATPAPQEKSDAQTAERRSSTGSKEQSLEDEPLPLPTVLQQIHELMSEILAPQEEEAQKSKKRKIAKRKEKVKEKKHKERKKGKRKRENKEPDTAYGAQEAQPIPEDITQAPEENKYPVEGKDGLSEQITTGSMDDHLERLGLKDKNAAPEASANLTYAPPDEVNPTPPPSEPGGAMPYIARDEGESSSAREIDDEWTDRLRYLSEHGTASLKDGEAFMFSEETGEATLFQSDGTAIRRNIARARNAHEVALERRPDILKPEDLMYNLSLLAKLLPKQTDNQTHEKSKEEATFSADNVMGQSQDFFIAIKRLFHM